MNNCKSNLEDESLNSNALLYLTNVYLCFLLSSLFISRKTDSTHWQLIKERRTQSCFPPLLRAPTLWESAVATPHPVGCLTPGGKEEHLLNCRCAAEHHLTAWLTFDIPLNLDSILQAQNLVQLLYDHLQLVDLRLAGQGYLIHGQVDTWKSACKQQNKTIQLDKNTTKDK